MTLENILRFKSQITTQPWDEKQNGFTSVTSHRVLARGRIYCGSIIIYRALSFVGLLFNNKFKCQRLCFKGSPCVNFGFHDINPFQWNHTCFIHKKIKDFKVCFVGKEHLDIRINNGHASLKSLSKKWKMKKKMKPRGNATTVLNWR